MKRVAVYARVSTARQEEEQTVDNQLMELRERIKQDGNLLAPEGIYKDEGWSGAILERPDLDRMRADAHDSKFEILYTYDRGRLSRKFVHQELILDELRSLGVEYISLHDINGTNPEEIMMGGVMGLFHEYERLKITERFRIGKIRKVREAKKLLGYNPKYGYDYHPRMRTGEGLTDGYFSINSQQAAVVTQIFQWIAEGHSKHEVRRMLFESGTAPPKGRRPMWASSTLDRLLRDTTYYGDHYYNKREAIPTKRPQNPDQKYRKVAKGSRRVRPQEEWMLIKVPAIIDKELFDKVQLQLIAHVRLNPRNNKKNEYLLNGLIECTCGKARTGDPGNKTHLYYRCTDRLSKFPMPRECYERAINAPVMDAVVWKQLAALLAKPKLLKQQAERWLNKPSPTLERINSLKARLNGLDDEERRYTKAYGTGLMSERLYKQQAKELLITRSQLTSELSVLETEIESKPQITLEQAIAGAKEVLRSLDLTDRKFIVRKLVDKIVATQKEATIWGHIPILAPVEVGYEPIHRHCRPTECRQIDPVQCTNREQRLGCKLSIRNY